MTGRQEHNLKIEKKIQNLLIGAPQYLINYSYNFDNKTATTKKAYLRYVMDFCDFFKDRDIMTLKKSDINKYMDFIKFDSEGNENGVSIRNARLAGVKDFYKFLVEDGYITDSPCVNVKPPREYEEKEIIAMTPEEMQTLMDNVRNGMGNSHAKNRQKNWMHRDLSIIMLGCTTGLRCSAITEIDVDDVDFENNTIKVVEKGNKIRTIYVSTNTIEVIKQWLKDRESLGGNVTKALFISNRRQRISQKCVSELLAKYTANLSKKITPHKMRSSCATNLYDKTGDIYLVQEVLGHKNIANTRRYARMSEEKKIHAADIMGRIVEGNI